MASLACVRVEIVRNPRSTGADHGAVPAAATMIRVPATGQTDPNALPTYEGRRDEPGLAKVWNVSEGGEAVYVAVGAPPAATSEPRNFLPPAGYLELPMPDGAQISFARATLPPV